MEIKRDIIDCLVGWKGLKGIILSIMSNLISTGIRGGTSLAGGNRNEIQLQPFFSMSKYGNVPLITGGLFLRALPRHLRSTRPIRPGASFQYSRLRKWPI